MKNNRKKFCFIICVNDDNFINECELYINRIKIPYGYSIEVMPIYKTQSIAESFNRGMSSTDAKYKIYMSQDVLIINPNFLNDILTIFKINWKIGMIGMIGSPKLSASAVSYFDKRVGNDYSLSCENINFEGYEYRKEDGLYEVEAIDGFLMVTKEDVLWRQDLFDGPDFYDLSQSFEFRKKGYKIVVPEQKYPWTAHRKNASSPWLFDKYRKIFIKEYMS